MLEHNIHVGFSYEPVDSALFDSFTWYKDNVFLIVGENHRLANRSSVKLRELQDEAIIIYNDDSYPENALSKFCLQNGVSPSFYLEGFDVALFNELCSTNKAVAFWAGPLGDLLGCVTVQIEDMNLEWEVHFIVQRNVYLNDAEKTFIEYAKNNLPMK
jgi:DNA-binding transcriptional LysR family regulator